jgi:hypothetical protein
MAASVDLNAKSLYLLNKYFIRPVLSLNTSVTNLDSNVNTFNNSTFAFNTSILANISSITILNISVSNLSNYITNFNTSVNLSVADINSSILEIKSTASGLNTSVLNLSNYVTTFNSSFNLSVADINSSILEIKSTALTLNTSVSNLSNYVTTLNTSVNNAIDTVNSTTLTIGGTNGTSSQSYAGALTSGTLNLATAITTGNINIGSSTATNQVNIGGVLVGANAINASTNGTNFQIASTNTSGSISIGSSQTSGILNIGTSASRSAAINIGSASNTGIININTAYNSNNDLSFPAISIGTSAVSNKVIRIGNNTVLGGYTLGNLYLTTSIAESAVFFNTVTNPTSDNANLFSAQTSGVLNIGVGGNSPGIRTATGNVNIANQVGNLCAINIMNGGGATTEGSVNIANGTLQTTTVNIASGSGTGTVTIGNASNTTTINSGTINMPNPPTMTYTTLPTFTQTQIGYTIRRVITTNTTAGATGVNTNPFAATTFTLDVGVWMMIFQLRFRSSTGTTTITRRLMYAALGTGQSGQPGNLGLIYNTDSYPFTSSNLAETTSAIIVNNTANNVLTPLVTVDYSPNTLQYAANDSYFIVTRIA